MTDERIASGKFMSLDRLGNIMLEDVVEQRWLAYHDVSTADAKSNVDVNTADASVTNSADNNNVQQHVHHTKDESGLCQWTTERSLTQAVIIGMKVAKVEIMMREWEARLEKTTE